MIRETIIKKTIVAGIFACFAFCCNAQAPLFISPYKDGRPVADSLKDYSQPVKMSMLASNKKATVPVKQDDKLNQQPGNTGEEKTKPVVLSPAKKP